MHMNYIYIVYISNCASVSCFNNYSNIKIVTLFFLLKINYNKKTKAYYVISTFAYYINDYILVWMNVNEYFNVCKY